MLKLLRPFVEETFDYEKVLLSSILRDIGEGRLQLPNLQRSWRWTNHNIVKIIESVGRGHPIGAVMTIEASDRLKFQNRYFEGVEEDVGERVSPAYLMLDGQQRCTSLFQACLSSKAVRIESDRKTKYRRFFFDMHKALYVACPLADAIVSYPVDWQGRPIERRGPDLTDETTQYALGMFPVNAIFDFEEWKSGHRAFWDAMVTEGAKHEEALQTVGDFGRSIVRRFEIFEVPLITLRRGLTVADVCKVYENLNSLGVALDAFDLLIAHFAAEGHCLRTDWFGPRGGTGLKGKIERASLGLIRDIDPKQFMQAVALANGARVGVPAGMERDDILALSLADYIACREAVVEGFSAACDILNSQGAVSENTVPSMLLVIGLSAIMAILGAEGDRPEVRSRLMRWFWTAVLTHSFDSHATRLMAENIPVVTDWLLRDGEEPFLMKRPLVGYSYIADAKVGGSFHRAFLAALIRGGAVDISKGIRLDAVEGGKLEEMAAFPHVWCKQKGIQTDRYDSAVNRILLPQGLRARIAKLPPSEYLLKLEAEWGFDEAELDARLTAQGIDAKAFRADDFSGFYAARIDHIASVISDIIGTAVVTDDRMIDAYDAGGNDEFEPEQYTWVSKARGAVIYLDTDDNGFFIKAGSMMSSDAQPSLERSAAGERERMMDSGTVLQEDDGTWLLLEDYRVSSPSHAYSVFTGQKAIGHCWRDNAGRIVTPSGNVSEIDQDDLFPHAVTKPTEAPAVGIDEDLEEVAVETADDEDSTGEVFDKVVAALEAVLGEQVRQTGQRFSTASGRTIKFSALTKSEGHEGLLSVMSHHLADDYYVAWRTDGGNGWAVPIEVLGDFIERMPTPVRKNDRVAWELVIDRVAGKDIASSRIKKYGSLDVTPYALAVG